MPDETPSSSHVTLAPGISIPEAALSFTFARSGGPGGQNVNKLATRATLTVLIEDLAAAMPADAVGRLRRLAGQRFADDPPRIVISAADTRSQVTNRRAAVQRLGELVQRAMHKPKRRVKTKPSRAAKQRRIDQKKQRGQLKRQRRGPLD